MFDSVCKAANVPFRKFHAPCKHFGKENSTHTHEHKSADSFCTFSRNAFQQVAVISGRDTAKVSEDSQQGSRQQGGKMKAPSPCWTTSKALFTSRLQTRGVFNERRSPVGCLKVGLSIHSFLMTLCITGRLLTEGSEPDWWEQSLQIEFALQIQS